MRLSDIFSAFYALFAIGLGVVFLFFIPPLGFLIGGAFIWFGIAGMREVVKASQYSGEKNLDITNSGITCGGASYAFTDIRHLGFTNTVTKKVTNFIPAGEDQTVTLEITVPGKVLKFVAGPTTGTLKFGSLGQKASQRLIEKYRFIAERSFNARLDGYVQSLNSHGYFIYDATRILENGDVEHKAGTFNLNALSSRLRRAPFAIYLQPDKGGSLKKAPRISTEVDTDVFYFLLDKVFDVRWVTSGAGGR